jgi:hypothetical protein
MVILVPTGPLTFSCSQPAMLVPRSNT